MHTGLNARARVAVLAVLAIQLIAGCGGDGETSTTAAPAPPSLAESESSTPDGGKGTAKAPAPSPSSEGAEPGAPKPDPAASSGAGDRSIQEFGDPADSTVAGQIESAVRAYFGALADNDSAKACGVVAEGVTAQFEEMLSQAGEALDGDPCELFLGSAAKAYSAASAPDAKRLDIYSVRVEGERGFALLTFPGGPKSVMPVSAAGGQWQVTALDVSPLP